MDNKSLAFSKFRSLMDRWDDYLKNENKLRAAIEENGLVFFFKRGDDVYGAPEMSRVTFAKIKTPDEDSDEGWLKEADFMGIDLSKVMQGEEGQNVFTPKDVDNIKIIDAEEAQKLLLKRLKNEEKLSGIPGEQETEA